MPDDLTAALEKIQAEADGSIAYSGAHDCPAVDNSCSAHNALCLLAALRAVLELAEDWDAEARRAADRSDVANERGEDGTFHLNSGRMHALDECAIALREAISREITRKGEPGA